MLAGVFLALLVGRAAASLLFEVKPVDVPTLIGVVIVLVVTSAVAAWIPGWRATRLAPVEALRS